MANDTSSSSPPSIPTVTEDKPLRNLARASSNADVLAFCRHALKNAKRRDKRAKWAYVYIASKTYQRREWNGVEYLRLDWITDYKIGVSVKPWNRMRAVGADAIVFSRLVYEPWTVEKALHMHFREWGVQDVRIRQREGDEAYLTGGHVTDEWFVLTPEMLGEAKRIIDAWQLLVTPILDEHPPGITRIGVGNGQVAPAWEYDSFRPDLWMLSEGRG